MSEKKLTPAEAFELIQRLNPNLISILRKENCVYVMSATAGEYWTCPNIDWGDSTSYKPERWRTATIEDVKRALDEPIECRSQGCRAGRIVGGYLSSTGVLIFNVRMSSDVIDSFRNVEVRE